jgi:hypothetical protein
MPSIFTNLIGSQFDLIFIDFYLIGIIDRYAVNKIQKLSFLLLCLSFNFFEFYLSEFLLYIIIELRRYFMSPLRKNETRHGCY